MAKCSVCVKSGLFLPVNLSGQCKDCVSKGKPQNADKLILSKDDKQFLDTLAVGISTGGNLKPKDVNDLDTKELNGKVSYAVSAKKYELAESLLTLEEKKADNVVDLHFCYNYWIELLYK